MKIFNENTYFLDTIIVHQYVVWHKYFQDTLKFLFLFYFLFASRTAHGREELSIFL